MDLHTLPSKIVDSIESERLPSNTVIFCQHGKWVYIAHEDKLPVKEQVPVQLESLGPFGTRSVDDISLQLAYDGLTYDLYYNGTTNTYNLRTPVARVTLQGLASDVANIPPNATHFCWIHPPSPSLIIKENCPAEQFLKTGGYAYFKLEQQSNAVFRTLRINALYEATNGLEFEERKEWRCKYTEQLWNDGRFQPTVSASLVEKGVKYYCFLNPDECVTATGQASWVPCAHGGFVFLYGEDERHPHAFDCYFSVADNCLGVCPADENEKADE
ncbi:unnamed protein product, partial [Didymodactylos carnosus]